MRILAGLTNKLILAASLMMNPINGITQGVQKNCDELLNNTYGKVSFSNWRPTKEEQCFLIQQFPNTGTGKYKLDFIGFGRFTDTDGKKYGYILTVLGDGISDMYYYDPENGFFRRLNSKTLNDARNEIRNSNLHNHSGTKSEE